MTAHGEGGFSGAKVVHFDVKALAFELRQDVEHIVGIVNVGALQNLQMEIRRLQLIFVQKSGENLCQIRLIEIAPGHIDRDRERRQTKLFALLDDPAGQKMLGHGDRQGHQIGSIFPDGGADRIKMPVYISCCLLWGPMLQNGMHELKQPYGIIFHNFIIVQLIGSVQKVHIVAGIPVIGFPCGVRQSRKILRTAFGFQLAGYIYQIMKFRIIIHPQ